MEQTIKDSPIGQIFTLLGYERLEYEVTHNTKGMFSIAVDGCITIDEINAIEKAHDVKFINVMPYDRTMGNGGHWSMLTFTKTNFVKLTKIT